MGDRMSGMCGLSVDELEMAKLVNSLMCFKYSEFCKFVIVIDCLFSLRHISQSSRSGVIQKNEQYSIWGKTILEVRSR